MSIKYTSCLASEVHLQIPDKVSSDPGTSDWGILYFWQDLECHSDIVYFGSVGISPEAVAILLFDPMSMLDACWDLNPVLVSGFSDA